ncbi:ser thr protein phosphatase family protein [Diplodia corticola]|uniref:Ser thr protein phosphatase family protein n=1 Tax=Diplodia corticola TaxID=236234 RepID=A0A1J9R4D8_9PEZI|nr:ser thr protein phosphatase family protein [Diplodia corticola]OJD36326.1 ser thr protein phosphatase family protein [Diplodia corticola]
MTSAPGLRRTRFVCISDTHNQTPKLPKGDVLIHAGDLTNQGSISELRKTVTWLEKADFEAKIVVAGNHDVTLDEPFYHQHGASFHNQLPQDSGACIQLLKSSATITYLQHEARTIQLTDPAGPCTRFNVFGSPYSPECGLWGFQYNRRDGHRVWDAIPLDTDVLITHAPPQFNCDTNSKGLADGCGALREALMRIRPSLHVCGHRHEGRGSERIRWKIDVPMAAVMEERTDIWTDPGTGNNKQSLVDLSVRGGSPIDNDLDHTSTVVSNSVSFTPATVHQTASSQPDVMPPAFHRESVCRPFQPPSAARPAAIATDQTPGDEQLISRLGGRRAAALCGRLGRRETCIVNAAVMAKSYYGNSGPKRFNKPIVVDLDLPAWPVEAQVAPAPRV